MKPEEKQIGRMLLLLFGLFVLSGCLPASEGLFPAARAGNDLFPVQKEAGETIPVREEDPRETSARAQICVYVCGAVANPGVYLLDEGARLYEAVKAAGGFAPDADPDAQNLAGEIRDGEQIRIRYLEEGKTAGSGQTEETDGRIPLNTASKEQLMKLPGIGEVRAEAIIAYRKKNGPFKTPEDLMKVPGIKSGSFEKLKDYIKTD